jgi:AcrR family transcriptional regulator
MPRIVPSPAPAALPHPPPPATKIARRQSRTRERILLESARLFLARGFESVSVDHVVGAAEIARSSFYRFFPNREEVLASIIRPVFESGVAAMAAMTDRPARELVDGICDMYLALWTSGPEALQLATRMGGSYFRLFQDVHLQYREALTGLLRRVQPTGTLLNGSGDYSARLIARSAVPLLEVYRDDPALETLFRQSMRGLLLKP